MIGRSFDKKKECGEGAMETKVIENGSEVTIRINGDLDTNTKAEAEAVLVDAAEKHESVLLDMSGVNYISSAGIRVLRKTYMTLYKKSGKMKMFGITDGVMSVLKMTGVDDMIELN